MQPAAGIAGVLCRDMTGTCTVQQVVFRSLNTERWGAECIASLENGAIANRQSWFKGRSMVMMLLVLVMVVVMMMTIEVVTMSPHGLYLCCVSRALHQLEVGCSQGFGRKAAATVAVWQVAPGPAVFRHVFTVCLQDKATARPWASFSPARELGSISAALWLTANPCRIQLHKTVKPFIAASGAGLAS